MTNRLVQLPSGPNSNILRFLGDDSKAIGGLKVACTTYERNISRLEEVAHPILSLRYCSTLTMATFVLNHRLNDHLIRRIKSNLKPSLSPVLATKSASFALELLSGKLLDCNDVDMWGVAKLVVDSMVNLASQLKAEDSADKQEIVAKIVTKIYSFKRIEGGVSNALRSNFETFLGLIESIVDDGRSIAQQAARKGIIDLLAFMYITFDETHEVIHRNLRVVEILIDRMDLSSQEVRDSIFKLLRAIGQSATIKLVGIGNGKTRLDQIARINSLGLYHWAYRQRLKSGMRHTRHMYLIINMIAHIGEGNSHPQQALRALISRFTLDIINAENKDHAEVLSVFQTISQLRQQIGEVFFGGSEYQREALKNIQDILGVLIDGIVANGTDKAKAKSEGYLNQLDSLYQEEGFKELFAAHLEAFKKKRACYPCKCTSRQKATLTQIILMIEKEASASGGGSK